MDEPMSRWPHVVALLDLDAFYVSVELRRRPELKGLPVVVAGEGPRSVVTTASYEARRYGVGSAMPSARARRLCPEAIFLRPDFPTYRDASREVMGIVSSHVESVEVVGLDEAYLDLSGWPAPKAGMRRIVNEIRERTGLTASVGIGPNKLVAKVASDAEKPHGFVVLTQAEARRRFADSPCRLLPGIGARTAERLESLGIHTIGQLDAVDPVVLRAGFAANTCRYLQGLARFEHGGSVGARHKVASESRSRTLDVDVSDPGELERLLGGLIETLGSDLERKGRQGRTVGITVRHSDFTTHSRARTVAVPVGRRDQLAPVALELLRTFLGEHPGRPVRLLGVRVAGLESRRAEAQLQLAL